MRDRERGDDIQQVDEPPHEQQQVYTVLSMVLVGIISQRLIPRKEGKGRVLAYEVLNATNAVRNLIRERQTQQIYSTIQTGRPLLNLCL